jgi:hypothetical protein
MARVRFLPVCVALGLAMALGPAHAIADEAANHAAAPIKGEADWKAYLAHLPPDSPLYLLSPLDRKLFIDSIRFGSQGLGSFRPGEVMALPPADGRRVLALFGEQDFIKAPATTGATALQPPPPTHGASQELTRYESALVEMSAASEGAVADRTRRAGVQKLYDAHFAAALGEAQLKALAPRDLRAVFQATETVARLFPDGRHTANLRTVYGELARRSEATDRQASDVMGVLFLARDFKGMADFHRDDPIASTLPLITQNGGGSPTGLHRELVVDDATKVRPSLVDLAHGAHVVVVSSPACHFTRLAVDAIEHDPRLSAILDGHSTWIEPAGASADLGGLVAWDASHPKYRIDLASAAADWPEVAIWQTPVFLFFRDGKVVETVTGWPDEGNGPAIEKAWAKANGESSRM